MQSITTLLGMLLLSGIAMAQDVRMLNVSYDPTRELHEDINSAIAENYQAQTGKRVAIEQSHGGSSKQMRAVLDGLKADIVTPALAHDVVVLEQGGLVKSGWQQRLPSNASPYTSTIVFVVRKGNPKGVKDWQDLIQNDVKCVAANPKTGGGARWIFLAAWGSVLNKGGTDDDARKYVTTLYKNMPVLDTGARAVTNTFTQKRIADVMLAWENEAWLTLEELKGQYEIVYPSVSILAEPPIAVVDKNVDEKGTRAPAEAYVKFYYTPEAQDIIGSHHYRPRDPEALKKYEKELPPIKLFTIDELFGGWDKAQPRFFSDGGEFDRIFR